jgi:MFS family permease
MAITPTLVAGSGTPLPKAASTEAWEGQRRLTRGSVAAIVVGNSMEFYDFVSYAFFAVYIGRAFFPSANAYGSLLASVATFGVGFLTRPLGGFLIGAIGDRAGRKPAMMLTIALITVGTLGLACTPSYASIGVLAPVLVVIARLLQGLALGGEVGPSTALLIEGAPAGQRGLYSSWQLAGQGLAACAGGLVGVILAKTLTPEQLGDWGWRVPFLIGLLILPVAIYIRSRLPETIESNEREQSSGQLFSSVFVAHRKIVILAILTVAGGTVSTYLGNYMTTYAITTLKLPPSTALAATLMAGSATVVGALFGGWLSDRLGRKPLMIGPRVLTVLIVYPAFQFLVAHPGLGTLLSVTGFLAILTAISGTAGITLIPEVLPKANRCTVIAVTYAIGVAVFGGTTQFVVTWLLETTGNPLSPALYVMAASVISLVAMFMLPETNRRP